MRNAVADSTSGSSIGGRLVNNLRYADDVAIITESQHDLQTILDQINTESKNYDLFMNVKKTKVMVCSKDAIQVNIQLDKERVEQVDDFVYLGASCSSSLNNSKEIKKRLAIARSKFSDIQTTLKSHSLKLQTKLRLLNALIFPIATYGCEAWTLKKADVKVINSFEMWCFRRILNISWKDKRTNDSILAEICPTERLIVNICKRKLQYFGHVARGSAGDLGLTILQGKVQGKRSRGRPRTTWVKNITDWTGVSLHTAMRSALHRKTWKDTSEIAATYPLVEDGT